MDKFDLKDLNKKYAGTFIRIKEREEDIWETCYVDNIFHEIDSSTICIKAIGRDNKYSTYDSKKHIFNFDFPPIGIINYKKTVAIASIIPLRQWKKAVYPEIYKLKFPLFPLIDKIENSFLLPKAKKHPSFKWKVEEVHELFSSSYFSFEDALSLLKKGTHLACAISREFYLMNSYYNGNLLICNEYTVVAEIKENGEIFYINSLFEQELKDFFNRMK